MEQLSDMPNLGPVAVENLKQVGIETPDQLRSIGAKEAWLQIKLRVDSGACLHMLQGLEGAVEGVKKASLSPEKKAELNKFYKTY